MNSKKCLLYGVSSPLLHLLCECVLKMDHAHKHLPEYSAWDGEQDERCLSHSAAFS